MPTDTREKRGSLINLGLPVGRLLPQPSGGINIVSERIYLLYGYATGVIILPRDATRYEILGSLTGPGILGSLTTIGILGSLTQPQIIGSEDDP